MKLDQKIEWGQTWTAEATQWETSSKIGSDIVPRKQSLRFNNGSLDSLGSQITCVSRVTAPQNSSLIADHRVSGPFRLFNEVQPTLTQSTSSTFRSATSAP